MYEHHHQPLLSRRAFLGRMARHFALSAALVGLALLVGVIGYHALESMAWIDALLNASMLLGGMGPVGELHTVGGKLFASFYALFSGLVFISVAGIVLTPVAHRVLHRWHVD